MFVTRIEMAAAAVLALSIQSAAAAETILQRRRPLSRAVMRTV